MPTMVRISVLFWLGASSIHMLPVLLGWHSVICLMVVGALRSNVMIVPHHGSNTSSSQLLLDVVQPDIAIVSRGERNRFGHPQADVVRRYDEKRVIWLDTAEQGAVLVKVEQGRVDWRTWADTQMRFWHSPQHSFMR